jgi:ferredoxin
VVGSTPEGCRAVPVVRFADRSIECPLGANLRVVLLRARLPLYRGVAKALHCRGHGTCGTCAVRIDGPVSEPTPAERRRLRFPPHRPDSGLRLACQCSVLGDIAVTRYEGLWGQRAPEDAKPGDD